MGNQKGITLVALILIIVLLIILAGISVALVFDNETEEKPSNTPGELVYNEQSFNEAFNEYTNSLENEVDSTDNNIVENDVTENTVAENTVENATTNEVL